MCYRIGNRKWRYVWYFVNNIRNGSIEIICKVGLFFDFLWERGGKWSCVVGNRGIFVGVFVRGFNGGWLLND